MQAVVYRIIHIESGRCYVGHSTQWDARKRQHITLLAKGKHHSPYLQHAWTKYGPSAFLFEVLEMCGDDAKLIREQHWIDNTNSCFNYAKVAGSRKGVPQSPEANEKVRRAHLGSKRSPEQRLAMSLAQRGKPGTRNGKKNSPEAIEKVRAAQIANPSRGMLGKHHSPEVIERIRASNIANTDRRHVGMLGKSHSDETREKIRMAKTGRRQSPETIAKRRASLAAFHASRPPEWLAAHAEKISAAKRANAQ